MMNIILLGPPGAGKGTQGQFIATRLSIPQISTGNILRDAVSRGTELGVKAKSFMDKGDLVPDDVVIGLIRDRIQEADCAKGYILDGFPRNVEQAKALDAMLTQFGQKIDRVFDFRVSAESILKRLLGRLTCSNKACGAGFHKEFKVPKEAGKCDLCGSDLYTRADDNEETILNRNAVYEKSAEPLRAYYEGKLLSIDADDDIHHINELIVTFL